MKIVNFGETYQIYSDDLRTYDKLPSGTYKIEFSPMSGFSLTKIHDFQDIEGKTYGSHPERIEKVLRAYDAFQRSLGIILSGDKGMGKSLFVQLLAKAAVEKGLPVIMVPKAFKGVADFIEKIDQEVLVVFDEFEKVFPKSRIGHGHGNQTNEILETQDDLLGLFDGTSQQKRLYAVTVNDLHQVNQFMVSRTGRFHYHIRFDYPTAEEIEIYLKDKLEEQYYGQIRHVIAFANRVKLNYDSLRAIAFELNSGYTFRAAIGDLNILSTDRQLYDVRVIFADGKTKDLKKQQMNLFSESIRIDSYYDDKFFSVTFNAASVQTDGDVMVVPQEHINIETTDEDGDRTENVEISSIVIHQHKDLGVNYKVLV